MTAADPGVAQQVCATAVGEAAVRIAARAVDGTLVLIIVGVESLTPGPRYRDRYEQEVTTSGQPVPYYAESLVRRRAVAIMLIGFVPGSREPHPGSEVSEHRRPMIVPRDQRGWHDLITATATRHAGSARPEKIAVILGGAPRGKPLANRCSMHNMRNGPRCQVGAHVL
jgi:hypothetical protein